MKGSNTLEFNAATMIAAMDHYLRTVLLKPGTEFKVTGISLGASQRGSSYPDAFLVVIEAPDDAKP